MNETYDANDGIAPVEGRFPDHPELAEARQEMASLEAASDPSLLSLYRNELMPVYQRLNERWHECLTAEGGQLVGMELANSGSSMYALILKDPSEPGRYRAQYFAECGFTGHSTYDTSIRVFTELLREGFDRPAAGTLERICQAPVWQIGMQRAYLIEQMNQCKLSFEEFVDKSSRLKVA